MKNENIFWLLVFMEFIAIFYSILVGDKINGIDTIFEKIGLTCIFIPVCLFVGLALLNVFDEEK
jgi:hypothetical protein